MSACVSVSAGDCRFFFRNRKRWYAAAGLFQFFLLLYIMSLFIWDIHFQGNHHYSADTLVRYLDMQDVRYGMKKKKINCEELEAGMREAFPQITWVSPEYPAPGW